MPSSEYVENKNLKQEVENILNECEHLLNDFNKINKNENRD